MGAVINEAEILSVEQVEYIQIPVDFTSPTNEDLQNLCQMYKNMKIKNSGFIALLTCASRLSFINIEERY